METQNGVPSFKKKKTCPTCFRPRKSSVFLYPSNFRKKKETNSWVFPKIGVPPPKSSVLIVGFCMIFIFSPSILGCNSLFLETPSSHLSTSNTTTELVSRNWCQDHLEYGGQKFVHLIHRDETWWLPNFPTGKKQKNNGFAKSRFFKSSCTQNGSQNWTPDGQGKKYDA